MRKYSAVTILIILTLLIQIKPQGMLKVSGKKIIDGNGNEIILKGIGLGGWLLQEGYMLHTSGFANAEHEIRTKIQSLIGEEKTNQFYQVYHENHVREKDISKLAEWGFNSVRIPMHYARLMEEGMPVTFKESGFAELDSLLVWCKNNRLYLILDLHAAPGGQSDEPISDYDSGKPSLWESETNQQMTIELWRELARRYANEEWIGGYDVLNEPKWDLGTQNIILRSFYMQITDAIRQHDTNHIIIIEGNWFATDFAGLTPPWDNNMVYSFHRYWNTNNTGAINYLLDIRNTFNVPLWLGETGENSNVWFTECVKLMDQYSIGWAWWPHKKISSTAGPLSAELTADYQVLLDYWNSPTTHQKPSEDFAFNALIDQARRLNIDSCHYQPDVINALLTFPENNIRIPYKEHNIPGTIFAADYDMGNVSVAYNDNDYQNTSGSQGGASWNSGGSYRNDGVDIEKCSDQKTNGFNVGWIVSGEWLRYTVNITEAAEYDVEFRIAGTGTTGKIIFRIEEQNVQQLINVPSTGGWQNWQSIIMEGIELSEGEATMTLQFLGEGFNLNYIEVKKKAVTDLGDNSELETEFKLAQNYPNPFNNQTVIKFYLPMAGDTSLKLYTCSGQLVKELMNENLQPGNYSVRWDSEDLSSGVYFYSLSNDKGFKQTKKALLIK